MLLPFHVVSIPLIYATVYGLKISIYSPAGGYLCYFKFVQYFGAIIGSEKILKIKCL